MVACKLINARLCLAQDTKQEAAGKIDSVRLVAGTFFYLHLPAGSTDEWSVMTRPADGSVERTLLDAAALAPAGKHAVIFDIEPS